MTKLVIKGSCELNGNVKIRGAKNAALPIIISCLNANTLTKLYNVPTNMMDIKVAIQALKSLGGNLKVKDGKIEYYPYHNIKQELSSIYSNKIRYSLLFLGMLVGKFGYAKVNMPGGCNLGDRKFDLHLEGLKALGAKINIKKNAIEVYADFLKGCDINFYLPTTTGTENIILAACYAKGRTRIFNANTRPEIKDFANFLNKLGAKIKVENRVVEINGPTKFKGCEYSIMSGWDEALFYIFAAGMTNSEVCIKDFNLDYIKSDISYLKQTGLEIFEWGGNVYVSAKNKTLSSFDLFTAPYPGVNSDMQPLFAAFASQCLGESSITDQRFTDRFQYVKELKKLGMNINTFGNCAVVKGGKLLKGNNVNALDLRCGAALILSSLKAKGTTIIDNAYQIFRGHEHIVKKLLKLGVNIRKV